MLIAVCALGLPGLALGAGKALSTDLAWGIPQSAFAPTRAAIADLGARWVRIEFRWNEAEPSSKGSYDPNVIARYDQAVETARAAGAQVLVFVNGAPRWASGSRIPMTRPQNPGDYADFLRYVAARYAGRVAAWEVWNEENTQRFWSSGPNAAQYTQLLKAAYPAVKAADPGALVVFGGVSQNDYAFIEGAYQAGAKGSFDVMAVHPYPGPNPPEAVWYAGARVAPNAFTGFREVRTTMLASGDDKPLWLTEFGWSTTTTEAWGVTPTQQADYLTRAYRLLENYPYITQAYWYNLRNNFWDQDADTWETQLGLTHTDFTHKPSYDAFKNYQPGAAATPAQPGNEPTAGRASGSTSEIAARVRRATRTFITLRRRRLVLGRVAGASGGRVKITLSRLGDRGRWKRLRPRRVSLGRRQTFRLKLVLPRPQMRVQAHYEGSTTSGPSHSRVLTLPST